MLKMRKVSRILSFVVMAGMLLAAVMPWSVLAEEEGRDYFIITGFTDNKEWETENITYPEGTPLADMKFPAQWEVTGYKETNENEETEPVQGDSTILLKNLEWFGLLEGEEEGSEEFYTEESAAGTYYFTFRLPEEVKLAEEVKTPGCMVEITEVEPEPEQEPEQEPEPESEPEPEPEPEQEPECKHVWKDADCTTPKTCTVCGATDGEALGHIWKDADCITPKTCAVCGVTDGEALGHIWKDADCITPKTCTVCGATEGEAKGHAWSEWATVKKATVDAKGTEERKCTTCEEKETREVQRLNRIGEAKDNKITGIEAGGTYGTDVKITFKAHGAGMDNQDPIKGDVRYIPAGWKIFKDYEFRDETYTGTFSIDRKGEFELKVSFCKQTYDGEKWISGSDMDTKTVDFKVTDVKKAAKTGDYTNIAGWAVVSILALAWVIGVARRRSGRK